MATTTNQQRHVVDDFSGACQRKTTKFQSKPNEVDLSINADYERIGGVEKIKGYERLGNTITTSTSSTTSSTTSTSTSTSSTTTGA